jgi:hypothetical protein
LNIVLDVNDELSKSVQDDTWLAPFIYFSFIIVSDLIPMTSQIASMLVVVDEGDFSQDRRSTLGDTWEGNFSNYLTITIESYEFIRDFSRETDELILNERHDDCKSLSSVSHPSKYQIG